MTRNFDQIAKQGGSLDFEDQHDDREPDVDDEPPLCGIGLARAAAIGIWRDDVEGRPRLAGMPETNSAAGGSDNRELSAEAGARICRAQAADQSCKTDHSGRHVDIDDSRINARRIRSLSPKQEELLAPRIDGWRFASSVYGSLRRGPPVHAGGFVNCV